MSCLKRDAGLFMLSRCGASTLDGKSKNTGPSHGCIVAVWRDLRQVVYHRMYVIISMTTFLGNTEGDRHTRSRAYNLTVAALWKRNLQRLWKTPR